MESTATGADQEEDEWTEEESNSEEESALSGEDSTSGLSAVVLRLCVVHPWSRQAELFFCPDLSFSSCTFFLENV